MDFHHFESVDTPLHEIGFKITELLAVNKKVTSKGNWYASLPFGDPKRLRNITANIADMVEESINRATRGGVEDLELQEAALKAANMVGKRLDK
jgi:hypothetical protein